MSLGRNIFLGIIIGCVRWRVFFLVLGGGGFWFL